MTQDTRRPSRAEEQAADFYGRLNSTVIENDDLTAFEAWKKESPENRRAYERLSAFLGQAEALRGDPAIDAIARETLDRAGARKATTRSGGGRLAWGAGLCFAGVAALAVAVIALPRDARYQSGVGERKVVALADGSRVELNTDSEVRVRLSKGERHIDLVRGQALFEVAHDAARPFIVDAGDTQVRAIGTRFDVYRRAADVQVTLTQGRVEVRREATAAAPWTLKPGQQITVGRSDGRNSLVQADVAAATSWTAGQLTFHDTPLSDAVAEVNRYSRKRVVLAADAPRQRRVGGVFPTGDVDAFTIAASDMLGLDRRVLQDGAVVELRGRGTPP